MNLLEHKSSRDMILDMIATADRKCSVLDVYHHLAESGMEKKALKAAVRDLIQEGELQFNNVYGTTYIEKSYDRPRRISRRVTLAPSWAEPDTMEGSWVVLSRGVAFGGGEHVTTRLAIRALDEVLSAISPPVHNSGKRIALDIGCGTGVLAITAVKLGIDLAEAVDVDPCAVAETNANIDINGLTDRITVRQGTVTSMDQAVYDLVVANLRYPTLIALHPMIIEGLKTGGWFVCTGLKSDEANEMRETYLQGHFEQMQRRSEKGWDCMVFRRTEVTLN